jgi:site-specific recombinase XerD
LAQTALGTMPLRRATWRHFRDWYGQRSPTTMAASSRKRNMSSLRGFLKFCVANGWANTDVLRACSSIKPSPERRDWLRPETVKAITPLLGCPDFDDMDRFA